MFSKIRGNFIWLFSISCVVVGILIALVSLLAVGFDTNRLNTDGEWIEQTLVQNLGEIREINIDVRNVGIEVRPSEGDEIVIRYHENNRTTFTETVTANQVSLVQDRNGGIFRWFRLININLTARSGVVVEIPEEAVLSGSFRTTNGRVEISGLTFEELQARSSNGQIRLEGIDVNGETNVRTTNAMISVSDVSLDSDAELETSNGRIYISQVSLGGHMNMKTSNGNINLSGVDSDGDIVGETSNGRVELTNVTAAGDLEIGSSNGNITFENTAFNNGEIVTTNGRVIVNGLQDYEDYQFVTRTSNGSTDIGEVRLGSGSNTFGSGERLFEIRTSNGNIEVNF